MVSEKGKALIVVDGFKFGWQKSLANDLQRWTCVFRRGRNVCKCFLKLNIKSEIVESNLLHDHPNDSDEKLDYQNLSNSLKRTALEDPSIRPSKLLCKELRKADAPRLVLGDVLKIRKNIGNSRLSTFPKLPKTFSAFHEALDNMNLVTNEGENFLLLNDSDNNIVCFSTLSNFKALCSSDDLTVDGTFYSCTKLFKQVFAIHGCVGNIFIPLVFFLLPDKKQSSYENAFSFVKKQAESFGFSFAPKTIRADFEMGIHSAIRAVFPMTRVLGCRFHLGQSWWKKIQELGLVPFYRDYNSEISCFLRSFFGLPFLDPSEVGDCFATDLISVQPDNPKIDKFCDYVLKTYIAEDALFPPEVWAEFSSSVQRTTNNCESFHSKFNSMFYTSQPNIYQFTEALLNVQTEIYIKMRSTKELPKEVSIKKSFVTSKMTLLQQNHISRYDFIKEVSAKFLPAFYKKKAIPQTDNTK